MAWLILILASLFEIGFALCLGKLRYVEKAAFNYWFLGFLVCIVLSIYLLFVATKSIPLGTAYAIWTGIGGLGIVLIGIFFFKEPVDFWRIFFLVMLVGSLVGLKWVSEH